MAATFLTVGMTSLPTSPECGERARLAFTAENPNDDEYITVESLAFTLPMGPFSADIASGFADVSMSCNLKTWQISGNGGVFTATPKRREDGKIGHHDQRI